VFHRPSSVSRHGFKPILVVGGEREYSSPSTWLSLFYHYSTSSDFSFLDTPEACNTPEKPRLNLYLNPELGLHFFPETWLNSKFVN
jgi:hypothetical protein